MYKIIHNNKQIGLFTEMGFQYDTYWIDTEKSVSPIIAPLSEQLYPVEYYLASRAKEDIEYFRGLPPFMEQSLGGEFADSVKKLGFDSTDILSGGGIKADNLIPCYKIKLKELVNNIKNKNYDTITTYFATKLGGKHPKITGFLDKDTINNIGEGIPVVVKVGANVKNEYKTTMLAKSQGIKTIQCKLVGIEGVACLISKRYDFDKNKKLVTQSLANLWGENYKNTYLDYYDLLDTAVWLGSSAEGIKQLIKLCKFNFENNNTEDHAKNFEFIRKNNGSWEPAPAFDLTTTTNQNRAMGLYGKKTNMLPKEEFKRLEKTYLVTAYD